MSAQVESVIWYGRGCRDGGNTNQHAELIVVQDSDFLCDYYAVEVLKITSARLDSVEIGFQELSTFIKPVAARLLGIEVAGGAFISSQDTDSLHAIDSVPFHPPIGLDKCVDGGNRFHGLEYHSQDTGVGTF